jgi:hypothetical protein
MREREIWKRGIEMRYEKKR